MTRATRITEKPITGQNSLAGEDQGLVNGSCLVSQPDLMSHVLSSVSLSAGEGLRRLRSCKVAVSWECRNFSGCQGVNLQPRFSTQRRQRRCTQGMWLEWVYHPRSRRRSKKHPWWAAAPGRRRPSLDCSLATSCWWLLAAVPRLCGLKPPTLQPYKLSYDQTKKHILKREGTSSVFSPINLGNLPLFFRPIYTFPGKSPTTDVVSE